MRVTTLFSKYPLGGLPLKMDLNAGEKFPHYWTLIFIFLTSFKVCLKTKGVGVGGAAG